MRTTIIVNTNPITGGVNSFFNVGSEQYYADLSEVDSFFGCTFECMIFPAKNNKVTSWSELYCANKEEISKKALIECINEFLDENFEKQLNHIKELLANG